ncbi:MAG: beta-galactosidase trimerization domain-containing protein [Spirochaetaceae bacterium]
MKNKELRFRQIHLDFHTSPVIEGIGEHFDKTKFQQALLAGHVDSITCFSSCHHGLSYHPTKVGTVHPNLKIDLLRAQLDACHEIDVKVPVYLTAGVDNLAAEEHPEWREIDKDGSITGWTSSPLDPGFKTLCFNSPYLEYLCSKINEVVTLYPESDGIFLDIISQSECCCPYCMEVMKKNDLNPTIRVDRLKCSEIALISYYQKTTEACKIIDSNMPIFHNSGNIPVGRRDIFKYFSHHELESLPTGGWGYDHFPFTAKYTAGLEQDFLGMTGKFHTTWGEFGGFKHPNALRYECSAMLAYGAKCSIGDQLHPSGIMDETTYRIIGEAYSEVEKKEDWCNNSKNIADIAILNITGNHERLDGLWDPKRVEQAGDIGASRVLLEGHFLFDVIDDEMDFSKYRVIILPDDIKTDPWLKNKLDKYLSNGGKLFITGESGVNENGESLFDIGGNIGAISKFSPDYIQPHKDFCSKFLSSPMVMYTKGRRLNVTHGKSLGRVFDPYFNRAYNHFCSHQHTPFSMEQSKYDCGVLTDNIVYIPHKIFSLYRLYGAVVYKDFIIKTLNALIREQKTVTVNLPSTARLTITSQDAKSRKIIHLLYGNTVTRGGGMNFIDDTGENGKEIKSIEVIEELLPLYDIDIQIKTNKPKAVLLEPQHKMIDFKWNDNLLDITVEKFTCHQMVVIQE